MLVITVRGRGFKVDSTLDGLNQIQNIKSAMNKARVNELSPKSVMLTSSLGFPGLINLITKGSIRLSKNIAWLSTGIITSCTLYMFDVEKLKKVVYLLLFLYLVIKNLPYLLDIFGVEPFQFASNDENWKDSFQNRKITVENRMIEYQKEQLKLIKNQLSALEDQSNLTPQQLEDKESLLEQKVDIERFINKEVKEKINLTKGKSSYNTSNISGSKRSGEDLNAGPSQKK